jgi:hypothetical protein
MVRVALDGTDNQIAFRDAIKALQQGDFSRLDPLFEADQTGGTPSRIVQWFEDGLFSEEPGVPAEVLTCACFLGRTDVAEFLLREGLAPSGGANTGLNAFHWAVNRGQLEAVRLLIRWKAPSGPKSMYGGNVLDTAVWSAINEPRPNQLPIIEELLQAGARLEDERYPTGNERVDAILRRYLAV